MADEIKEGTEATAEATPKKKIDWKKKRLPLIIALL